jgi:hypothetical protein
MVAFSTFELHRVTSFENIWTPTSNLTFWMAYVTNFCFAQGHLSFWSRLPHLLRYFLGRSCMDAKFWRFGKQLPRCCVIQMKLEWEPLLRHLGGCNWAKHCVVPKPEVNYSISSLGARHSRAFQISIACKCILLKIRPPTVGFFIL